MEFEPILISHLDKVLRYCSFDGAVGVSHYADVE